MEASGIRFWTDPTEPAAGSVRPVDQCEEELVSGGREDLVRGGGLEERARAALVPHLGRAVADGDRAAHAVGLAQPAGDPLDQAEQHRAQLVAGADTIAQRPLAPHGAIPAGRIDPAGVVVVGQGSKVSPRMGAEQALQFGASARGEIGDGLDAVVVELRCGDGTDAPEHADRKRVQERLLAVGFDDHDPVGLGLAARDLGEEFGASHADRQGEPHVDQRPGAERCGDVARFAEQVGRAADVEERLVDRDGFDERGDVAEELEHLVGRFAVGLHPGRHDDGMRAQFPRLAAVHRRTHAARSRLVARRHDDALADDDRSASQLGVVALLDRGVEGVEIGVKDGGPAHPLIVERTAVRVQMSGGPGMMGRWLRRMKRSRSDAGVRRSAT